MALTYNSKYGPIAYKEPALYDKQRVAQWSSG